MKKNDPPPEKRPERHEQFTEGVDYYFEDGLMVLTAEFLRKRGYCCQNGCRHCPYDPAAKNQRRNSSSSL